MLLLFAGQIICSGFYFAGQKQKVCWANFVFAGPFAGQKQIICSANYLLGKICYFAGQIANTFCWANSKYVLLFVGQITNSVGQIFSWAKHGSPIGMT